MKYPNASTAYSKRHERPSFPDYGVDVTAITIYGEIGIWRHGQYGWYPKEKWGIDEYPHHHIIEWELLPIKYNNKTEILKL